MPITNTQIVGGAVQPDGRQRFRYHYTHSEGKVTVFDRNMVPSGFDTVADAAAKLPEIEQQVQDEELRQIENDIINGGDHAILKAAAIFNTADEVDTFLMKRTANRLRPVNAQTIAEDAHAVAMMEFVFQASGPTIGGLLGLSTQNANKFKSEVQGLVDGIKLYDTEFLPLFPEVE